MNEQPLTESPPQWVIEELHAWFATQKNGSFAVNTAKGQKPKLVKTIYESEPMLTDTK